MDVPFAIVSSGNVPQGKQPYKKNLKDYDCIWYWSQGIWRHLNPT